MPEDFKAWSSFVNLPGQEQAGWLKELAIREWALSDVEGNTEADTPTGPPNSTAWSGSSGPLMYHRVGNRFRSRITRHAVRGTRRLPS